MRKDFILSDEEKQRRKKRLEENRNFTLQRLSTSDSGNSSSSTNRLSSSESLSPKSDELDRVSFYFSISIYNYFWFSF
jgi:hypothetical protein